MPGVIDETLVSFGASIPPGETIESREIDVSGAEYLTVNVTLEAPSPPVQRQISFGRRGFGSPFDHTPVFVPFLIDTFGSTSSSQLLTLVPVHGPMLTVTLRNLGNDPAKVAFAWVYGARKAS